MKIEKSSWIRQMTGETFATFGTARLIRHLDGRFELIGGTPADHAAARQWCSLFAPTIVFTAHLERPDQMAVALPSSRTFEPEAFVLKNVKNFKLARESQVPSSS